MKKYITAAALLAAGAAFANAETITTTFSNAGGADDISNVVLDVSGIEGISGTVKSLVTIDNATDLGLTTAGDQTFFSPNTNVGTADGWIATFSYTFTGTTLKVESVTLDVGIFTDKNGWQGTSTNRDFVFTVALNENTDSSGNWTVKGNKTANPENGAITLTFSDAITITDSATLVVTVDKGTTNPGCFLGLHDVKFNVIPEPSAFGMLAGLGALALVASRRRRK